MSRDAVKVLSHARPNQQQQKDQLFHLLPFAELVEETIAGIAANSIKLLKEGVTSQWQSVAVSGSFGGSCDFYLMGAAFYVLLRSQRDHAGFSTCC